MSAHTPGPWIIATSCSWRRVMTESGEHVCTPTVQSDGQPDLYFPNGGADGPDARLIAAAPDIFGCLTMGSQLNTPDMLDWIADRLVSVHGESPFVDFVVSLRNRANSMRKAIAKAKGESP